VRVGVGKSFCVEPVLPLNALCLKSHEC
jgi:hypothetical protein